MQHMQTLAGAFVLLSGLYLLYYFWVVDVNGDSGRLDGAVLNFQTRVMNWLNANWQVAGAVLAAIVVAAIVYVTVRRRPRGGAFGRFGRA